MGRNWRPASFLGGGVGSPAAGSERTVQECWDVSMQPDESYLKGHGQRDTPRTHPGLPGAGPEAASPEQPTACRAGRSTGLHTFGKGFSALQVCAPGHPCELRENCTEVLGTSGLPVKAFMETESPTRGGNLPRSP